MCLRSLVSAGTYEGGLRWAISRAKFHGERDLWRALAGLLAAVWPDVPAASEPGPLLVPVPLGRARRRERGFNQAQLLAASLSRRVRVHLVPTLLQRCRETRPQSRLTREDRQRNVQGAFRVRRHVRRRPVVLIDDVVTTGSTLDACAAALLAAGAAHVDALTAAAAPAPHPGGTG